MLPPTLLRQRCKLRLKTNSIFTHTTLSDLQRSCGRRGWRILAYLTFAPDTYKGSKCLIKTTAKKFGYASCIPEPLVFNARHRRLTLRVSSIGNFPVWLLCNYFSGAGAASSAGASAGASAASAGAASASAALHSSHFSHCSQQAFSSAAAAFFLQLPQQPTIATAATKTTNERIFFIAFDKLKLEHMFDRKSMDSK